MSNAALSFSIGFIGFMMAFCLLYTVISALQSRSRRRRRWRH